MARQTKRAPLYLSEEDRAYLGKLSRSATAPVREATRAKVRGVVPVTRDDYAAILAEYRAVADRIAHLPVPR